MQMAIQKKLVLAGLALLTIPGISFSQEKKEAEKKDLQTIVITRTGEIPGKTTIEIVGDKIKVNGKDVKDLKDIQVNVNTIKEGTIINAGPNAWTFSMGEDHISLFDEDSNRAMLGVITEKNAKGAEIKSITAGSAADKMGLKKGDILIKIGDKKIVSTGDVTEAIRKNKPGQKVEVTYLRDGKEEKKTGELGKWKGIRMNATTAPNIDMPNFDHLTVEGFGNGNRMSGSFAIGKPKLGMSIQDTDDGKGVKIIEIEPESNAAKAGLKKDDILLSVDDVEIKSTDDVTKKLRANSNKFVYKFRISRNGNVQDLDVNMPRKIKTADL
jgi:serine protease Do